MFTFKINHYIVLLIFIGYNKKGDVNEFTRYDR